MEFLILLTLFVTLLSSSTQVISLTNIYVLYTQPTAVLTKTMSLFRNLTCVLTQRQCTHDASIGRRQQVDASNVTGDANAPQGQTRARTHQSPELAAAAPPAAATQIYTAPSVLTRKDYRGWTLGMYVPAHAGVSRTKMLN